MSEDEARVERVARAICMASGQDPDFNYDPSGIQRTDDVRWRMYESKALAAIAATTAWQPIETAPRDGTKIDLWHPTGCRFADAFWCKQTYALYEPWGWTNRFFGMIVGVTHWMPLPEPPR